MGLFSSSLPSGETFGALAQFDSPAALFKACEKVRDAGYKRWDAHSPFPIHGLEAAMGLSRSKLPYLVLVMGLAGASGGMFLQYWVATTAYPLTISGKPLFSWQAFVPVTFELGVLAAALGSVFGMFAFNQLPMLFHPLFNSKRFERVTDDGFFISVESWDPQFDAEKTVEFLRSIGADHVETVPRG